MESGRRLKVRLPDDVAFRGAQDLLSLAQVRVYVHSPRRLTFSIDEVSDELKSALESLGARITDDTRYEPDVLARSTG